MNSNNIIVSENAKIIDLNPTSGQIVQLKEKNIEYLTRRAVPIATALAAGLRSVDGREAANLLGRKRALPGDGMVIPFLNTDQHVQILLDEPHEGAKCLSPTDQEIPVYIPESFEGIDGKLIVIVESAIKALSVGSIGYPAVGLSGTGTTLVEKVDGRRPNASWKKVPLRGATVVILFDSNRRSNPNVARDEARLVEALEAAGATVLIAELPPDDKGTNWGPDDFINARGAEALREIISSAKPANPVARAQGINKGEAISLLDDLPFRLSIIERGTATQEMVKNELKKMGIAGAAFRDSIKESRKKLQDAYRHSSRKTQKPRSTNGDQLPEIIVTNRQVRSVIEDSWLAVHKANKPPSIFLNDCLLVRLVFGDNGPRIEPVEDRCMYGRLARIADWYRLDQFEGKKDARPPKDVVADMIAYPDQKLFRLDSVIFSPVYGVSGKLLTTPGFYQDERLYLHLPRGFSVPQIPTTPSRENIQNAVAFLEKELLGDFPFIDASSLANAIASLILFFVRRLISGPTPLHLIESPKPGTGKGLFSDVISILATGKPAEIMTEGRDDDEWRKRLTSVLVRSPSIVLLDNLNHKLDSGQLAAILTAPTWTDRLLGKTRMITLPIRQIWLATANNARLSSEIIRRTVRIRIDARVEHPHKRTGFKHPDLLAWTKAHRTEVMAAVFTLVNAWIAEKCPKGLQIMGSFEEYAAVLGGILDIAGIPGFLSNAEQLFDETDDDTTEWQVFLRGWWEKYKDKSITTNELFDFAVEEDLMMIARGDKGDQSQRICLGKALRSRRDQVIANLRIVAAGTNSKGRPQYRLEPAVEQPIVTHNSGQHFGSSNPLENKDIYPGSQSARSGTGSSEHGDESFTKMDGSAPYGAKQQQLLPGVGETPATPGDNGNGESIRGDMSAGVDKGDSGSESVFYGGMETLDEDEISFTPEDLESDGRHG
ncbi:MAG: DUF3854 domain-containing protein [Proteobacteria bacterium]|nr:DUF3854 domain-containing protein [Pseudomonadota bacterium]